VFLPFDYLGSEEAMGWVGSAVPSIAAAQISSIAVPTIREAHLNRIQQIVDGYITGRRGDLRISATVRDETGQSTVKTLSAHGTTVVEAAASLAAQLSSTAKPYTSNNPEAIKELFTGHADAALALDPAYGAAHVARIEALVRTGRKDELPPALADAKLARLTDVERARLQALVADTPKTRTKALLGLARATRLDLQIWRTAGEAALVSKDQASAIEAFQKVLTFDPANVVLWNTLAYAQAFTGDVESARASLAEYRRLQPKEANAVDSLGEVYYINGRFQEAEKSFLEAFELNNALLNGGDMYRAALSRFLAGDRMKADEYFRRYIEYRQKHNDALVSLREAVWLYSTGRRDAARQKALRLASPAGKAQLALWDLADGKSNPQILGDRPELQGWKLLFQGKYPEAVEYWSKIYESSSLITGSEARVLLAWSLTGAGRLGEGTALLEKWPLPPAGPEPGLSSIVLAKTIELKAGHR
jgi:tetratricopeptide (TPR) repeat protein